MFPCLSPVTIPHQGPTEGIMGEHIGSGFEFRFCQASCQFQMLVLACREKSRCSRIMMCSIIKQSTFDLLCALVISQRGLTLPQSPEIKDL